MKLKKLKRELRDFGRVTHVLNVVFTQGLGYVIEDIELKHHLHFVKNIMFHRFEEPILPEVRLRRVFEQLGGTYVKLGQLLSLRPDMIPINYCEELRKLQDRVAPFPGEKARQIVEAEFKKPIHKVFKAFNEKPVAAASISQVHEATLKSGKKVVVKVQRPNIRNIMMSDIDVMYYIAHHMEKKEKYKRYQPVAIIDEFKEYTEKELDFTNEANNAERFFNNFSKSKIVKIPEVYREFTTSKVLTMERIEGIKLTELKGKKINRRDVAEKLVNSIVKQVFEDGLFHADMHPGNIMLCGDKIAFLDFGIVGRMSKELRDLGFQLMVAIMERDLDRVTTLLIKGGSITADTNIPLFKQEIEDVVSEWSGETLSDTKVTHMMHELFNTCIKNKIKMPVNLILLGKGFVTVEATCTQLYPEFNFSEYTQKYVSSVMGKKFTSKEIIKGVIKDASKLRQVLVEFPDQLSTVMEKLKTGTVKIDIEDTEVKRLGMEIDRSSNRVAYGMIIAALVVGGAVMAHIDKGPRVWEINAMSAALFAIALIFGLILAVSIEREIRL